VSLFRSILEVTGYITNKNKEETAKYKDSWDERQNYELNYRRCTNIMVQERIFKIRVTQYDIWKQRILKRSSNKQ
jgi:hypothetical protein